MKTVIRHFLISVLLLVELFAVFYATTFVMSYLFELDRSPIAF